MQDVVNTLTLASVYLLFALGLSITWGTTGILNFAHGAVFMFCAFLNSLLVEHVRLPMIALVVVGAALGAALSTAIHLVAFDSILRRAKDARAAELQILVAGIGIATIPLAIAQRSTRDNPFGYVNGSSFVLHTYHFAGVRASNAQIIVFVTAIVVVAASAVWVYRSKSGLALRAIGVDAEVASMMGVNRRVLATTIMAVSGAIAGLAGVLLTYSLGAIAPETGDSLLIKAFAAIVLGGVGSIAGASIGVLILALSETIVLTHTSGTWVDVISFGLIFLVLLVRPQGILGRREVRRT